MSVRVTAVDEATGVTSERIVEPGSYALIVVTPCRLVAEDHDIDGTTKLTLKGRRADFMGTVEVEQSAGVS